MKWGRRSKKVRRRKMRSLDSENKKDDSDDSESPWEIGTLSTSG